MKKRIISLILVLVMLCLALASCGAYSLADEDIAAYATFDADSKAKFEEAWKALVIEDGDFTTDPTIRDNKVWDSIYNVIASAVTIDADKLTTGVPSGNDIIYYNYYYTAVIGEETYYFTANMKSGSTASIQLGLKAPTDFETKLAALFAGVDIKDYIYTTETVGEVKENDVVFISYSYTYNVEVKDETTGEVATKPETVKVSNERLVLTKDSSPFVNYLLEKKAAINSSSIEKFEDASTGRTYTDIKINWRAKGNEIGTATDVTYTEKQMVTDITGIERDLKDVELTYHIYPVHFITVPEFNALNFINVILDDSITFKAITRVLFGEKFDEKTEE
ncbi:MAG: hypothetical protein IJW38_01485, partial [Clostridia bacterium]|nr:hypothetical protein [Clostridia bacterium]